MAEKLPESLMRMNQINIEARDKLLVTVINRRRYVWDMICESRDDRTTNKTFFETLNNMRFYFYSPSEQAEFASVDSSHHSNKLNDKLETHNDYHDVD